MSFRFIDVHCHPNLHALKDDNEVLERMRSEKVAGIVVGVDAESSREAVRLAGEHEHLWATIGLHPNYTQKETFDEEVFEELATHPKVVGIGECGLDYFRLQGTGDSGQEKEKKRQFVALEAQVQFAEKHDLPLMVHCRPSQHSMDAYHDFLNFIEPYAERGLRGNMHFFVGDLETAQRFWNSEFTTSFTGVLTFTNDYDEVVRTAPLDMILTETDAPYATPVPHRGTRNEPVFVSFVVDAVARIRDQDSELVREALLANACRLFNITP
jgi:TatD DNase family protein